nr:hypothetical protein [Rubrimonas cliftonensis]
MLVVDRVLQGRGHADVRADDVDVREVHLADEGVEIAEHPVGPERVGEHAFGPRDAHAVLEVGLLRDAPGLDRGLLLRLVHVDVEDARIPVVRAAGVDGIAAVEAPFMRALAAMPCAARAPFADHGPEIARFLQQLRDSHGVSRQIRFVAGMAFRRRVERIVEGGQPDLDGVGAGQQHRARDRADRRGVEAREQRALAGKPVDVRRARDGPGEAEIAKADVVAHDEQDVGTGAALLRNGGRPGEVDRKQGRADRMSRRMSH